ncbi:MAG: hypothetical protein WD737_12255 [Gemmatimonadota bacterium]
MKKISAPAFLIAGFLLLLPTLLLAQSGQVPITVEEERPGAPVTFGIPFPEGELYSVDHVRVLTRDGGEIASQITPVTTWLPADESIKWIWIDFFLDGSGQYLVEYGEDVRRAVEVASPIQLVNNQRDGGGAEINTGTLRFTVEKRNGSGFIDQVEFNPAGTGFLDEHLIAQGIPGRGTFLDLIDDAGPDESSAVVHQQFIERGSGPLHAIIRVEGEYQYERPDHPASPFVTYIHAYAGKSYIKVLHTITYTGKPDKSAPLDGREHRDIATQSALIVDEDERSTDAGITQPEDMIAAAGFGLTYNIDGTPMVRTALSEANWWEEVEPSLIELPAASGSRVSLFQTGPDPNGIPPVEESGLDERIGGFYAKVESDGVLREGQRAEGWIDLSDGERGVGIGIRNMLEEYPNQLVVDLARNQIHAYSWPAEAGPKSFERWNDSGDGGMVANFAQGVTKTTELVLNFHDGSDDITEVRETVDAVLDPAVAHAGADWYRNSGVYGTFATANNSIPALERSLQYKFDYMQFNQKWAPWYGMFDYGDLKIYFRGGRWTTWGNNEPAQDFQWWINFMRTGERSNYLMAEAMSRHTMDVDNTHWPTAAEYRGDTNSALDYWNTLDQAEGSPYLGMGSRHSNQQAISKLSAHVWVPGWIASYYLSGYHRGLDVARLTGDYYVRRIFGEHGLTGRRLYLSVWNLAELYDATKDEKYLEELQYRVDHLLELQKDQGGRMVIDRYGYSQNYASHGLSKYLQFFDDREVELAMVEHARNLVQNPPLDHEMESFLSSIHALVRGYDLTGNDEFLMEACRRAAYLRTDTAPQPLANYATQRERVALMEGVSNLPGRGEDDEVFNGRLPIWSFSNGLRIFGWTHIYGVPYLIDRLQSGEYDLGSLPCT